MIKAELRKLRTLKATPQMIEKAKENKKTSREVKYGCIRECKREYAVFMRCQKLGGYLKIAIFMPEKLAAGAKEPRFELFINVRGREWITREWVDGKETWSNAMLENLNYKGWNSWNYLYYSKAMAWINKEGNRTIRQELAVEEGGYEGILKWQKETRKERIEEKERRETKPWDDAMKLIPELPKRFKHWVEKEAITDNFLFYEYKKEGATEGYCSHCDNIVKISGPKHNKKGRCPKCKRKVTYKSTGKIKTLATPQESCQIIQGLKGGFVVRSFWIYKSYAQRDYKTPYIRIHEHRRVLYCEDGTRSTYEYENYRNKTMRWVKIGNNVYGYCGGTGKVYKRNIAALEKTVLKYSALPMMVRAQGEINCEKYLYMEQRNKAIEPLAKIGMINMVNDMIKSRHKELICENATELTRILKIDKSRLKRLKSMEAGICGLEWMQLEKEENTIWPDEMIEYFDNEHISRGDFEFIEKKMNYVQIYNYLKKQNELCGDSPKQIIRTWRDYMDMVHKMNLQTKNEMVYKPKNLKERHNELIMLLQEENIEKQAEEVRKKFRNVDNICKTLKKYEYETKEFAIIAPGGITDIIREGVALQHCIHTCDIYFDRINRRETYLLFLRKTDQKNVPWYTMEVEPGGNIRQKRTTGDNQNKDFETAVTFLKKWQKEVRKRMSREEKELAKKSNQLRIEGYKKLRQNGNRIWHGKLQGKLLVDVLEEDFMEVTE